MFRTRQPLRKLFGASLSHVEYESTDEGVRKINVSDCRKLPPVEDFDLDINIRAGENLKEVSSVIVNGGRVNLREKESVEKTENNNVENGENENEK